MRALIRELAPAKINLFLHVGARRDDGYHPLQSLAVFTGGETAADVLSLAPADAVSLSLDGPFAVGLEGESDNLVLRAARVHAGLRNGDFVAADDVQAVARWVMAHRLVLKPEAALDGDTDLGVVGAILEATPVPR